jgi:hypothetical protein
MFDDYLKSPKHIKVAPQTKNGTLPTLEFKDF